MEYAYKSHCLHRKYIDSGYPTSRIIPPQFHVLKWTTLASCSIKCLDVIADQLAVLPCSELTYDDIDEDIEFIDSSQSGSS